MKTLIDQIKTLSSNSDKQNTSFYEEYLRLKKEYEQLIEDGYTKRNGSILINRIEDNRLLKSLYNTHINNYF